MFNQNSSMYYCHIVLRNFFTFFLRFFKRLKKKDLYNYTDLYGLNFLNQQQSNVLIFLLKKHLDPTMEWIHSSYQNKNFYLVQSEVEALLGEEEKAVILFKNLFLKSPSIQKELHKQIQLHIYNLEICRLLDEDDFFYIYLYIFKKLIIGQLNEYKEIYDLDLIKIKEIQEKIKIKRMEMEKALFLIASSKRQKRKVSIKYKKI